MRSSPLKDTLQSLGASFTECYGVEVVSSVNSLDKEYHYIRDAAGLTDFSHIQKFRIPEECGLDFLDNLLAGNVARIRFGRILHTFLSDDAGNLLADCYVANNDDEFIVLCESIADDKLIRDMFTKDESANVTDITDSHVVIGVDGFKSWSVIRDLFGADILGLPYLSIETYNFEGTDTKLFRAGKTSEFGYQLLAPKEIAEKLFTVLLDGVKKVDGGVCSVSIHSDLRLEGRFFNIYNEGARVKDPLVLGLQYMIDFDKEKFYGSDAIFKRRTDGLTKKIIGVQVDKNVELSAGMSIYNGDTMVGEVQATCFSYVLDAKLGLALFDIDVAYSGLAFSLNSAGGPELKTISMPPIMPKSLSVKLDEI
ncbi:MAG TPA: glycine cleavage T C-terminal barrel domain-containing protein [Chitinispirillaceae bacterium]|nr:glycine cleavage T C-terminal barrel domain-containing protein [Chitinispirillaceae bacterium]